MMTSYKAASGKKPNIDSYEVRNRTVTWLKHENTQHIRKTSSYNHFCFSILSEIIEIWHICSFIHLSADKSARICSMSLS